MKKTTFVYLLTICLGSFVIMSYKTGAGTNGWDCTGAETGLGNPSGCKGSGCHATAVTTAIGVAMEIDSAGVPTTHYKGGMLYTIKLSGINNGTTSLPKYGLQIGAIKGAVAATTPVNAGTWTAPFPTTTHYAAPQAGNFVVGVVEQTAPIAATTGTGAAGTTYVKIFNWTAPVAGTGTVSFWAVLNAVNGNNNEDSGDHWNTIHQVVNEWPAATGIDEAAVASLNLSVFPNPANENIHLTYTLSKRSEVSVKIFDVNGRVVSDLLNEMQSEGEQRLDSNTSALSKGVYIVMLNVDGNRSTQRLVVQ